MVSVWPDYGSPGAPNMDPYYRSPAQVADDEAEHQAATDNLRAALMDAVAEAGKVLTTQDIADALQRAMFRLMNEVAP